MNKYNKVVIKVMQVYDITSKMSAFENISIASTLLSYSLKELNMSLDDYLNRVFENSIATDDQVNDFRNTNWKEEIKKIKESKED